MKNPIRSTSRFALSASVGGMVLLLASAANLEADEMLGMPPQIGFYRAREVSIDAFGTAALSQDILDQLSGDRIEHDTVLGAGAGLNYFPVMYVGIGGEGYTENTAYHFVDNVSGSLILRLPIGTTGLSPYAFGGGGYKYDPVAESFGHGGAGLEFRFAPNFGIFLDARYVFTDKTGKYGLGRAGFRFAF